MMLIDDARAMIDTHGSPIRPGTSDGMVGI
jgi:hypothetical protein